MARSRSRSPRWKHRSLSPIPRKSEHCKQRCSHEHYCSDYRKELERAACRMSHKKHVQSKPRIPSREEAHYRCYEHRSPSPDVRKSSLDDFHPCKLYQAYSPRRRDSSRSQYMSRFSEDVHYQEYCWGYPEQMQGGYTSDDHRARGGKGGQSPPRPVADSLRFEDKWHEDGLSHQRMQDEKYCQPLRRGSEDFEKRSPFQTRYLEDRDCRKYRHASKRSSDEKRYENREPSRNSHRRAKHYLAPYQEKKERRLRHRAHRAHRHAHRKCPEASSAARVARDYHHKRQKTSDEDQDFSDGPAEKYSKEEDRKCLSQIGLAKISPGYVNARRDRDTDGGHVQEAPEPFKTDCAPPAEPDKNNVIVRPCNGKRKKKKNKEREAKRQRISSGNQFDESKHSSASLRKKSKSLIVKIDVKKTVNTPSVPFSMTERQMSRDLVAVGRKNEDLDPVFEQLDSTENIEKKSTGEFAQEIITVIHEIKANHFPSSGITLHERFSKIKDTQAAEGANETKPTLDPEICRKIDMCLAELRNKNTTVVKVIDPNDLRHDIERRRKERLQHEDEHTFHVDGAAERNNPFSCFPPHADSFQNPQCIIQSNSRKFIHIPYMDFAMQRKDIIHNAFQVESNPQNIRGFRFPKNYFRGGRLQPHFKSGLVKKSLNIQAKYQRLRYAGSKGFFTNKFRERFLRKKKQRIGNRRMIFITSY